MSQPSRSGFVERRLINRDFFRLWYGMAVSTLGDAVFDTTPVLWIATVLARGRSWAPAAVSGVMLDFHASLAGVHMGRIDTIFTVSGLLVVLGGVYGAFALPDRSSQPAPA